MGCVTAGECGAFVACVEAAAPEAACDAHCDALAACDAGLDAAACRAGCLADYPSPRHRAWRNCVAAAPDCGARDRCVLEAPVLCERWCDVLERCDYHDGDAGCVIACEEAFAANAERRLELFACVVTAPDCAGPIDEHTVDRCFQRRRPYGQACLGFCRAEGECAGGDPADIEACLLDCAAGFEGDAAARFEAAAECLAGGDVASDCDAARACIPPAADAGCAALCGRLDACGAAPADCEAQCARDPLGRVRSLEVAPCVAEAGGDCAAVRACLDAGSAEPPPVDEATFCEAWSGCGYPDCGGAYEAFGGEGPQSLACALRMMDVCGADPGDLYPECLLFIPEPAQACRALCRARDLCDGLEGSRRACEVECDGMNAANPDDVERSLPQRACAGALTCEALDACLAATTPRAICTRHCDTLSDCGLVADRVRCRVDCIDDFARDRNEAWIACVSEAADCEAMDACAPAPPLPCAQACRRVEACGLDDAGFARCVAECDDAAFADADAEARKAACLLLAPDCFRDVGRASVRACVEGFTDSGLECARYCRAVTECDPAAEGTLGDCLLACADGLGAEDALRLAASRACMDGAGAACGPLRECLREGAVDCAADCAAVAACGLPAEGCADACLAAPDRAHAGCLAEAARLRLGCAGVAACVGHVEPPVDADCAAYCAEAARCDAGHDAFLCERACTPAAPVRRACLEQAGCGGMQACVDLGAEPAAPCLAPCERAVACGGFASVEACAAVCTGRLRSQRVPADYLLDVGACLDGACDARASAACFASDGGCPRACAVLEACGYDDRDCVAHCEANAAGNPAQAAALRACIFTHHDGGRCDYYAYDDCIWEAVQP